MMRTHRLVLDFERKAPGTALGYTLAVAGVLAVALAMGTQATLSAALERESEAAVPAASATDEASLPAGVAATSEALDGARAVVAHLGGPWESVFRTLESVAEPDVALLALTPDVAGGKIRIHAEARTLEAMLSYYAALQRSHGFAQVALAEHELRQDDPQRPVRFAIVASWRRP